MRFVWFGCLRHLQPLIFLLILILYSLIGGLTFYLIEGRQQEEIPTTTTTTTRRPIDFYAIPEVWLQRNDTKILLCELYEVKIIHLVCAI